MTSLDAKLFAWYRLRTEHDTARARLRDAMGTADGDEAVLTWHGEVERLRGEMERLLKEIDALRLQRADGSAE